MSFTDPIATAIVEIEPVAINARFQQAAEQAANNFNSSLNNAMQRLSARVNQTFANLAAGARTLGQAIAARLPASITNATRAMTTRFGQAFGTITAGFGRLNASATAAFTKISGVAAGAAIAIGAILLVATKLTQSFAEIADGFRQMELGLQAVIASSDTANISFESLNASLRDLGANLGVSTTSLGRSAQQLITLGISGQQTVRVLTAISTAGARVGATTAQTGRALDGLTQIVSKGTLQMEELRRQIAGNLPGALDLGRVFEILAENLGVTTEEVRKLQENGQITADQALPAITQAMEELNAGVDVFALRASTLNGLLGIIRENFNQIVGTAFQPFIEALVPTFKSFIDGLKAGTGPFKTLRDDIGTFGESMGEIVKTLLTELGPVLGGLFHTFVQLTKALTPLIKDIIGIAGTVGRILVPVLNVFVGILDVVLNRIPILSNIFRALAAGLITGGLFKAFSLFGRALGSIGGLIGRIATPVSKLAAGLANFAPVVAKVSTVFVLLKAPINELLDLIGDAISKVGELTERIFNLPGLKQIAGVVGAVGGAIGDAFSSDNANKVGKVFAPIPKATKDLIDMEDVFNKLNETLQGVVDDQEDLLKAQQAVKDAQGDLADAIKAERDARRDVQDAIEDEQEAKQDLIDINIELGELEEERAELVADTARDLRDIADAQRDLAKIGLDLLDIESDREEILEKIKELQTGPTADEIAAADNKIAKATLDLNDLYREQQELLDELNKTREANIDLSGLTLDQLRTTLAGLRAQTAAQRAVQNTGRTETDIQNDLARVGVDIVDAQIELNEAVQERVDLDTIVLENQTEIQRLTRDLKQLELDKAGLLDDQVESQIELNKLLAGETPRQEEIKKLDEDIARLKGNQRDAIREIRDAGITIKDNEEKVRDASAQIRIAQEAIRIAKFDQKIKTAEINSDERELNRLLTDRIGLNATLLGQATNMQSIANTILNNPTNQQLVSQLNDPNSTVSQILNLPVNDPLRNTILQLLASRFTGFEQGGMVTHPMLANIGEKYKHEMILPMTKPDRVWSIMSRNLPKYPAAMAAAQAAIAPSIPVPKISNAVSSTNRIINRDDGPATYGQIKELINILREQRTEVHVDAPITVQSNGSDELLLKKLERKLERNILDKISRR